MYLHTDMKALHHLPVQEPVAQKVILRKILLSLLLRLLLDRLRQMAAFLLQEIQPARSIEEQIGNPCLLLSLTVQTHCQHLVASVLVQLLYVGNHIIFHVYLAMGIRLPNLRNIFRQLHAKHLPNHFS